jgi:hypothetical protein
MFCLTTAAEDGTIVVQEDRSLPREQFATREASIYLIKNGGKGATPNSPERILEMDRYNTHTLSYTS